MLHFSVAVRLSNATLVVIDQGNSQVAKENEKPICGIVMPISALDGCSESHWADIQDILTEAIEDAGFNANLVSNADDVGVIHKRIIQNLYDNPIVVCDVSGKNPNVMFELGLRLAFDKPIIIVKDDKTAYSFDTSAIEHIEYPRDLRFSRIVEFKQKLAEKIKATHDKATNDPAYTTFLKHFGEFTVAKLDKKEVSSQEYILDELKELRNAMRRMERVHFLRDFEPTSRRRIKFRDGLNVCMGGRTDAQVAEATERLASHPSVIQFEIIDYAPDHKHIVAEVRPDTNIADLEKIAGGKVRKNRSFQQKSTNSD